MSSLDIDAILLSIGDFGPYQKRIYLLLCLPILFVGANNLVYVFLAPPVQYRCMVPGCDSPPTVYDEPFLPFTIPHEDSSNQSDFSSCEIFIRINNESCVSNTCCSSDFSQDITITCNSGYVFDRCIYATTIQSEYDLTCGNSWKANFAQTIYFGGMLAGAFLSGIISDYLGRRMTVLVSLVSMSISGVLVGISPGLPLFYAMRFLNAFASAGVFETTFVIGMEFVGPQRRVLLGVLIQIYFALGEVMLGLVAWGIRDWRTLQLTMSAPVALFTAYYWLVPESLRWLMSKGREEEVITALEKVAEVNKTVFPYNLIDKTSSRPDKTGSDPSMVTDHKVSLLQIFKSSTMALRTVFMVYIWIAVSLVYYGLSLNSTSLTSDDRPSAPFVNFILTALVEIPGYVISWFGMFYWGRKKSLILSLILAGVFCALGGFFLNSGTAIILTTSLVGKAAITCAFSIIYLYTTELYPTSVRNTSVGLCSMFARIGGMLAPFSSSLSNIYSPLPMLLFGGLSLVATAATLIMPETLNAKLPDTFTEANQLGKKNVKNEVTSMMPKKEEG